MRCVLKLAKVFGSQIDFVLGLRAGDRVRRRCMSASVRMDAISRTATSWLRVSSTRAGNTWRVRYVRPDGSAEYYSPAGRSTQKAFLRAPLEFKRISSGFSAARLHPILNTIRAHQGTDYAAPMGTPVYAAGAGRISFRGIKGGYGNVIEIDHGNGIQTVYGHLSRFGRMPGGVRACEQGETIGYVGHDRARHGSASALRVPHQRPLCRSAEGEVCPTPVRSIPRCARISSAAPSRCSSCWIARYRRRSPRAEPAARHGSVHRSDVRHQHGRHGCGVARDRGQRHAGAGGASRELAAAAAAAAAPRRRGFRADRPGRARAAGHGRRTRVRAGGCTSCCAGQASGPVGSRHRQPRPDDAAPAGRRAALHPADRRSQCDRRAPRHRRGRRLSPPRCCCGWRGCAADAGLSSPRPSVPPTRLARWSTSAASPTSRCCEPTAACSASIPVPAIVCSMPGAPPSRASARCRRRVGRERSVQPHCCRACWRSLLCAPPPKSTGRETFSDAWLERALAGLTLPPADVQATLRRADRRTIARAASRAGPAHAPRSLWSAAVAPSMSI